MTTLEYLRFELEQEHPLWENICPTSMPPREREIFMDLLEAVGLFKYKKDSRKRYTDGSYVAIYWDENLTKSNSWNFVQTEVRPKLRQAIKILEETEKYGKQKV